MSIAIEFLTTMAKVVATMNLYGVGHPARERAIDICFGKLSELQDGDPNAVFTFLRGEIIHGGRPIRDLRNWEWGARMSAAGVQRVELLGRVSRDDLEAFLVEVYHRVSGTPIQPAQSGQGRLSNIRYGEAGLAGEGEEEPEVEPPPTSTLAYSLEEELAGVEWLHDEIREGGGLHVLEAEGIVGSLWVAMHAEQVFLIPMLRSKEHDEYSVTHALNVSALTMGLAESLGLSPWEVRMCGLAGLLHDVGMVRIPRAIRMKPGELTEDEIERVRTHPAEGARIILKTDEHLDLAAAAAYEHHVHMDGGGYPARTYRTKSHQASNLVHVCDVFDALRSDRPYREAFTSHEALATIEKGAGTEFDSGLANAFLQMMGQWKYQVTEVATDNPLLPSQSAVGTDSD